MDWTASVWPVKWPMAPDVWAESHDGCPKGREISSKLTAGTNVLRSGTVYQLKPPLHSLPRPYSIVKLQMSKKASPSVSDLCLLSNAAFSPSWYCRLTTCSLSSAVPFSVPVACTPVYPVYAWNKDRERTDNLRVRIKEGTSRWQG